MSSIYLEDLIPGVKYNGLQTAKVVDFSNAVSVALPAATTIAGTTAAGTSTITSTSANALAVGRQGATNPVLNIDASAATVDTGLNIVGAAAASGLQMVVTTSGTNENLTFDAAGSGTIKINNASTTAGLVTIGNATAIGGSSTFGPVTITSASATAFTVGRLGATTPAFAVSAATGTQVTGILVTGGAAAGTVAVAVQGGTNEKLTIDANGSGTINIGKTSTGQVQLSRGALKAIINAVTLTDLGTNQSVTPTAAQLLGGALTHASTVGAGTCTLDTGTNISTAIVGVAVGDSFVCTYANTGSQTVTLTGASGSTMVGTVIVTTGKNAIMTFINTGSNAWKVYTMVG